MTSSQLLKFRTSSNRVIRILDFLQKQVDLNKDQLAGLEPILKSREAALQEEYASFKRQPVVGLIIEQDGNPVVASLEKFHTKYDAQMQQYISLEQYQGILKARRESAFRRAMEMRAQDGTGFFYDFEFTWK